MTINLRQLYEIVGEVKEFECVVSEEYLTQVKGYSFSDDVTVKGILKNRAGVLTMKCAINGTLNAVCDRCLADFSKPLCFESESVLVRELSNEDNDEYIVTMNDALDLDEYAISELLLRMPTRLLCKEECKGLCPVCHIDLNTAECDCEI